MMTNKDESNQEPKNLQQENKPEPFQRYIPQRPDYDIEQLLPTFETEEDIRTENAKRIRLLRRSADSSHQDLAAKLEGCSDGGCCNSPACRICGSRYRRYIIGEMLRNFDETDKLQMVTVVPSSDAFPIDKLMEYNPHVLMNRVRRQLKGSGLGHLQVMGGVELDLDDELGLWQPHLHFIVAGATQSDFKEFRKRFYSRSRHPGNRTGKQDAVYIKRVKDKTQAFSYCMKLYWIQLKKYGDHNGKIRYKDRRLNVHDHSVAMLKLDSLRMGDLTLLMGVQRRGKSIG